MFFKKERRKFVIHFANQIAALGLLLAWPLKRSAAKNNKSCQGAIMQLPKVQTIGTATVGQAINRRRTVRSFAPRMLHPEQLAALLWSAQGITGPREFKRAAPSAGALYPLDIYTVVGQESVAELRAGVYHYQPKQHRLALIVAKDLRSDVARAALSQMWLAKAPLSIIITAEYSRITAKYGGRGVRYAMIEAGHVGQNLFLQAEALNLKAGIVGAFHDKQLIEVMQTPASHEPLLIMPVGYAAAQ